MFHRASTRPYIARALALGLATGLRSQMANAALALAHDAAPRSARWTGWIPFRWPLARKAMLLAAAGEIVGDKLPQTPSRIAPKQLAGRIVFGAFAGAAAGSERKGTSPILTGAALGGIGAVAGSFGGYHARKWIVEASGVPDLPIAIVEDVIAAAIAHQAAG
jgi:uncharacterized membrane protein